MNEVISFVKIENIIVTRSVTIENISIVSTLHTLDVTLASVAVYIHQSIILQVNTPFSILLGSKIFSKIQNKVAHVAQFSENNYLVAAASVTGLSIYTHAFKIIEIETPLSIILNSTIFRKTIDQIEVPNPSPFGRKNQDLEIGIKVMHKIFLELGVGSLQWDEPNYSWVVSYPNGRSEMAYEHQLLLCSAKD